MSAGRIDIGLEGKMLAAAFASAATAVDGFCMVGLLAGAVVSVLLALLHGFACITHRGNQVVSGLRSIFLSRDSRSFCGRLVPARRQTPRWAQTHAGAITLPFADVLADVPVVGAVYSELPVGITCWCTSRLRVCSLCG